MPPAHKILTFYRTEVELTFELLLLAHDVRKTFNAK
jgi:hypothetical protein